jgi:hypothetical protein
MRVEKYNRLSHRGLELEWNPYSPEMGNDPYEIEIEDCFGNPITLIYELRRIPAVIKETGERILVEAWFSYFPTGELCDPLLEISDVPEEFRDVEY